MKKTIVILVCMFLALALLSGCAKPAADAGTGAGTGDSGAEASLSSKISDFESAIGSSEGTYSDLADTGLEEPDTGGLG